MKQLREIAPPVEADKTVIVEPEVDDLLATPSKDIKKFIKKHPIKKFADRVGNTEKVYSASDEKVFDRAANRYGYKAGEDAAVYESTSDNIAMRPEALEERTAVERAAKTSLHKSMNSDNIGYGHVGYSSEPDEAIEKGLKDRGFDNVDKGVFLKQTNGVGHRVEVEPVGPDAKHIHVSHFSMNTESVVNEALKIPTSSKATIKPNKNNNVQIKKFVAQLKDGSAKTVFAPTEDQAKSIAGTGVERLTTVRENGDFVIDAFNSLNETNKAKFLDRFLDENTRKDVIKFAREIYENEEITPERLQQIFHHHYDNFYNYHSKNAAIPPTALHSIAVKDAENYMTDYYDATPEKYRKAA